MPFTCMAISWLLVTLTFPAYSPMHWNRIISESDRVVVAEFARLEKKFGDGAVESSTTDGALAATNWHEQGPCKDPLAEVRFAFAVIRYDPGGKETDSIVAGKVVSTNTAEHAGNRHEAEYA